MSLLLTDACSTICDEKAPGTGGVLAGAFVCASADDDGTSASLSGCIWIEVLDAGVKRRVGVLVEKRRGCFRSVSACFEVALWSLVGARVRAEGLSHRDSFSSVVLAFSAFCEC